MRCFLSLIFCCSTCRVRWTGCIWRSTLEETAGAKGTASKESQPGKFITCTRYMHGSLNLHGKIETDCDKRKVGRSVIESRTLWNADICPIAEILWKTASLCKILLKLGNQLLSYSQKKILNMVAVHHLEFKKNWLRDCHRVPVVYQMSSESYDISLRYGDLTIRWRQYAILNFQNVSLSHDLNPFIAAILLPYAKFKLNRTTGGWVMADF